MPEQENRRLTRRAAIALAAAAAVAPVGGAPGWAAGEADTDPLAELELRARAAGLPLPASDSQGRSSDPRANVFTARADRILALMDAARSSAGRSASGPRMAGAIDRDAARLLIEAHREEVSAPRVDQPQRFRFVFDDALKSEYRTLFETVQLRPERAPLVSKMGNRLLAPERVAAYRTVQRATGVPWYVVGLIHCMEASFNMRAHLHNGDPLEDRTVQVPAGRPATWNPPDDWASSAIDALRYDRLAENADWSLEKTLFLLERYNGTRTRQKGLNTPYLWSFSFHYEKGKFVRDGVWDPDAVSQQVGAAVLLKWLLLDESVFLPGEEPPEG